MLFVMEIKDFWSWHLCFTHLGDISWRNVKGILVRASVIDVSKVCSKDALGDRSTSEWKQVFHENECKLQILRKLSNLIYELI
jgi:hypothetical protein